MCPHPHSQDNPIRIHRGEGIHVVRKGKAGYVSYLPYDNYTLNDDTYILTKKSSCKLDILLEWLANTHKSLFYEYATKSDNGTWNKTAFFEHAAFDIPDKVEQDNAVSKIRALKDIENELIALNDTLISILEKEII